MVKKAKLLLPLFLSLTSIFCVGYAGWTLSGTGVSTSVNASVGDVTELGNILSIKDSINFEYNTTYSGFVNNGLIGNQLSFYVDFNFSISSYCNYKNITTSSTDLLFRLNVTSNYADFDNAVTNCTAEYQTLVSGNTSNFALCNENGVRRHYYQSNSSTITNISTLQQEFNINAYESNTSYASVDFKLKYTFTVDSSSLSTLISNVGSISFSFGASLNV